MTSPDTYYTTAQLSDVLNIPADTLRAWRWRKKGPPYTRIEGAIRYRWADVQDWLEARTERAEVGS